MPTDSTPHPSFLSSRLPTLLACASLLAGCATVGPDYRQPKTDLPPAWSPAEAAPTPGAPAAPLDVQWWRRFDDLLLSSLVERGLAANADVRIARARLRAARAASAQAESLLWPSVNAYGSASRSTSGGQDAVSGYGLGFDAAWDIDLFGGLRRGVEALDADALASAATLASTRVSLAAEVARSYVLLRAYELRIGLLRAERACGRDEDVLHRVRRRQQHPRAAVLRRTAAPILRSLVRIVAVQACASSVS